MDLIYGTTNAGKLSSMKKILEEFSPEFNIIGLNDLNFSFPNIEESGNNLLANAKIKALAYYNIIKKPVFSLDSGLYFEGVEEKLQPGLNVRHVGGKTLTDAEMLEYYSSIAKNNGGEIVAQYRNGLCLIINEKIILESMADDIASEKFIICDTPHKKIVEGFPIDGLSKNIKTGKYYYDLDNADNKEKAWRTEKGFQKFFAEALFKIKAV